MIDKEYFIATMGFLIDTLGDTIENESVLGLCGSLILMFSWIFRAPESLFYGYMAYTRRKPLSRCVLRSGLKKCRAAHFGGLGHFSL